MAYSGVKLDGRHLSVKKEKGLTAEMHSRASRQQRSEDRDAIQRKAVEAGRQAAIEVLIN